MDREARPDGLEVIEHSESYRRRGGIPNLRSLARLEHFTWANFTLPMATGGLALLLSEQTQGFTFRGLQTIGKLVYILDLAIFTLVAACITYRFVKFPGVLKCSITHPTEGLFLGTSTLSLASIITGIARYGIPSCGPWLVTAYRVLFWIYYAVTFFIAVGQYSLLFTSPRLKIQDMTPAWDLPIFPFGMYGNPPCRIPNSLFLDLFPSFFQLSDSKANISTMLSGTIAATGAAFQPPQHAVDMIIGGLTAQGLGLLVSILMYSSYFQRMIQYGFPSPNSRPGMFIAVGPPSFTSLAIITLANDFPVNIGYVDASPLITQILLVIATTASIFIWSLSLWFFCISVVANLAVRRQMSFHLNWYTFVFPNVGFTISVIEFGRTFRSRGILGLGSGMTVLLVFTWIFVVFHHVRAIYRGDILAEGKDEDFYVDEKDHRHVKRDVREIEKRA